jgi:exopolysaccharide biosynthesis polyprenyl glycosylphosphotransferase
VRAIEESMMLRQIKRYPLIVLMLAEASTGACARVIARVIVEWLMPPLERGLGNALSQLDYRFMANAVVAIPALFALAGLYQPHRVGRSRGELWWTAACVIAAWAVAQLLNQNLPRSSAAETRLDAVTLCVWLMLVLSLRLSLRVMPRDGRCREGTLRQAAIVGSGPRASQLHRLLAKWRCTTLEVQFFIDDSSGDMPSQRIKRRLPVISLDQAIDRCKAGPLDVIIIDSSARSTHLIEVLRSSTREFFFVPEVCPPAEPGRSAAERSADLRLAALSDRDASRIGDLAKSAIDRMGAFLALAVLALPMLAIWIAIKCSGPGPAFYRQTRISRGGRRFEMIKFRTMCVGAETHTGPIWTVPNDDRVTRVGRLLRRTSLDELPQLYNVLKGDMSLVGPRPERPEFVEQFSRGDPRYALRHLVKGGMTGWAQIHGLRGCTSIRKRTRFDLYYVNRRSLFLDLRILLLTPIRGLSDPNAY